MKRFSAIIAATVATIAFAIPVSAQETVTLYAPISHNHDYSRAYFDFQTGQLAGRGAPWNLAYGMLRAGDYFDWFQTRAELDDRSLIKDLGALKWTDRFDVPVIEPLPKLMAGERRTITIDASGANGANGANGAPGAAGANGQRGEDGGSGNTNAAIRNSSAEVPPARDPFPTASSPELPKREPKVSPIFVKAIAGHMYAIHVVSDTQDYYALFRVEAVTRGDNCTISWRLVPAPTTNMVRKEN